MLRPSALPKPVRIGSALTGVAGIVALAGCTAGAGGATSAGAATYKDGTYSASGTYQTPETTETITVSITLKNDLVTNVQVTGEPRRPESQQYQSQFIGGISDVVVGKDIDQLSVSRVAGSSLTSNGFNQALDQIKSEAAK
ncbi:FMN-binding protein [Microbacterium candidum]|uniref:FMN-binding protein n=1 Tax=Microbacterium candidum TaxID=3041922 RepID=A0ABT7N1Y1_9MICO|nr:FMN-binding protein [Microbacterium sp. ASV49]MDL9980687.1 FMN-binding protein [Microbacterium sp. ASV49]